MNRFVMNPIFGVDFYKYGHRDQYPKDTTQVYSNWTARAARVPAPDGVIFFGLQYFIKQVLLDEWDMYFFQRGWPYVKADYQELMRDTLGIGNADTTHLEWLHNLGYLPIKIWALPEGFSTPLRVPSLVITNTKPQAYWMPNFLETVLSNTLWKACTSATTARIYRQIFTRYAKMAGETDLSFVDWMGHDFSFRGMSGREDAILSGMGHLLSFSGTDTVPAILATKEYYNASLTCGGSVPATEHSVMCAGEQDGEQETFRRLIQDIYPNGVVSVVSDTWDLWKVLTEYVPNLKDVILNRGASGSIPARLVIRPDSGDPVKIMTGDDSKPFDTPEGAGVLNLLARALGVTTNAAGYDLIKKAGAIYGDSITPERAEQICERAVKHGYSPFNFVLGIGSFTYEFVTRDVYGFAMKATAVVRDGKLIDIFKKPVTDTGLKNSLKGIPAVYRTEDSTDEKPIYFATDGNQPEALDNCEFLKVFEDGRLLVDHNFDDIRKRARS